MLISFKRGQGSIVLRVKILNSSLATGAGLTGLTSASSGLRIATIADNEAAATAYTVAGSTIESITTLGTYAAPTATKCRFKEVDATNHPGVYELQIADARFAVASAKSLLISISGATNAAETDVCIPLSDLDPYDSVRAGLTALPNAAPGAANGILVAGSNAAATFASLTCTGVFTVSNGIAVTVSSSNVSALQLTGNGSGHGLASTGGATGNGINGLGGASGGYGLNANAQSSGFSGIGAAGAGSGSGIAAFGGATGNGIRSLGGATSGDGIQAIAQLSGHGFVATAAGTSKHGFFVTGGTAGVSDGINAVAGTGGVDIRGNRTGNLTGTVSTVTTVTNQLTAAQIATGVWQDAVAGDFTVASSVGKSLYNAFTANTSVFTVAALANAPTGGSAPTVSQIATAVWQNATAGDFTVASSIGKALYTGNSAPGTAGGLFIAGANAATTVNFTGNLSGSVGSVTGAVGSVTGAVGSVTGAVGSIAAGGIAAASFVANAVNAAALATDAVAEIQSGLMLAASYAAPPTAAAIRAEIDANSTQLSFLVLNMTQVHSDTDDIQARLPAALVSGRMDAAIADKTGFKLAADGIDAITIETGLNARQALSILSSAEGGVLAGAASTTITVAAAGHPATNRITATVDADGNRPAITLNIPA